MTIRKAKGQFTIVALIATFMVVIAFAVMYPVINLFIAPLAANITLTDPPTATMLQLVPFFILLSIILTVVFIVLPTREAR